MLEKVAKRVARHARIRARVIGTAETPRLAVYRSNASVQVQMIDDAAGKTLCAASDLKMKSGTKTERAAKVGEDIAKKAITLGIKACVFDRGGFAYHGRVKALADAARSAGLEF